MTSLTDVHRPKLPIVWEKGLELPVFDLPAGAKVFARERWTGAPLTAGLAARRGRGAVGGRASRRARVRALSVPARGAARPGHGAALSVRADCGPSSIRPTARASTWITSPRAGGEAGIAALHVAAWHFFEPDPEREPI